MNQRTISKETSVQGIGIHSGQKVNVHFKPAEAGAGITFKRVDLSPNEIISLKDLRFSPQERRTALTNGKAEINTVEHLMAALFAASIDNIIIEADAAEMPGLDGSAQIYFDALREAGSRDLGKEKNIITIKEPLWAEKGDAFIGIFPSVNYMASYLLESPSPSIKKQAMTLMVTPESVQKELISARTFCLKEEAEMLLKMGFGKGANTMNTLVMDVNGPIGNTLRFPDEPVRHKLMDLIGDMYLLGAPLAGRIIAIRSGHSLNGELVNMIRNNLLSQK